MGLTFPFGGGGYKKPSCRTWAHLGSQTGPNPSLLTELFVAEAWTRGLSFKPWWWVMAFWVTIAVVFPLQGSLSLAG